MQMRDSGKTGSHALDAPEHGALASQTFQEEEAHPSALRKSTSNGERLVS